MSERPPESELEEMRAEEAEKHPYKICGAWIPKRGVVCGAAARKGRERCRHHGGNTPRGPEHPNFKHGRYSKELPNGMRERLQEALDDDELTSLRDEIGLITVRIQEVLKEAMKGRPQETWADLEAQMQRARQAQDAGDPYEMAQALAEMEELIEAGTRQTEAWSELTELIDTRRKLARAEHRRTTELQQMIDAQGALAIVNFIVDSVRRHVSDDKEIESVARDVQTRLLSE